MELRTENMTVTLTNDADESREYTISADVQVHAGNFLSTNNGQVFKKMNDGMCVAYFNVGQDESLSVNYQNGSLTDTQQVAVLNLIHGFVTAAKAQVTKVTE